MLVWIARLWRRLFQCWFHLRGVWPKTWGLNGPRAFLFVRLTLHPIYIMCLALSKRFVKPALTCQYLARHQAISSFPEQCPHQALYPTLLRLSWFSPHSDSALQIAKLSSPA